MIEGKDLLFSAPQVPVRDSITAMRHAKPVPDSPSSSSALGMLTDLELVEGVS